MINLIAIRHNCKTVRRDLPITKQYQNSLNCTNFLIKIHKVQRAKKIAVYMARDGELDLTPLISLLQRAGKLIYLPVLHPYQRKLWFARYSSSKQLHLNRFSIPEPNINQHDKRTARFLDVVLVPLVAFDANCHRLGMGGGFYDKTFAYQLIRRTWRRPHLIGIAHECQRVEMLPIRNWDVPMTMIITEAKVYTNTNHF